MLMVMAFVSVIVGRSKVKPLTLTSGRNNGEYYSNPKNQRLFHKFWDISGGMFIKPEPSKP
jgi:hypothetical protein